MGQPDEIAGQHHHRRAPAPARRRPLQGHFRIAVPQLQHYLPGQLHHPMVNQEEAGQPMVTNQRKLLVQPIPNPPVDPVVAPARRLPAQLLKPALGVVSIGYRAVGKAVTVGHVVRQVEV